MLSLGIEYIVGKELQRPQNRQQGPEEVGVLVSEEIDFLDNLAVSVHDDFWSQWGGKLIK